MAPDLDPELGGRGGRGRRRVVEDADATGHARAFERGVDRERSWDAQSEPSRARSIDSRVHRPTALAAGLAVGAALDALVPDPRRGHPVAAFGAAAAALERRVYADSRPRGAAYAVACVGTVVAAARALERRSGPARVATVAAGTWAVLGGRSLRLEAAVLNGLLAQGDLEGARQRITHLVSRDPAALDADGIARAAVESVAENTCDAVIAPLFWGAVAGLPGLLGYRAVNTLDAMVGYRSPHYANFGWAAARADDVANVVPARLTALLTALAARATGGDGGRRCASRAATGGGTRARTRASARPRSPARSACGWAGATATPAGSTSVPDSATGGRRSSPTCHARPGSAPPWPS